MAHGRSQLALGPRVVVKIGLVSPYDLSRPGGVQAQVLGLASSLRGMGDDASVIGPGLPDGVVGWDLGSSVEVPGNGSVAPISLDPRVGGTLRTVSRDLDVLHVHEPLMPIVSLSALRAGPPVVATFHAAPGSFGRRIYNFLGDQMGRLLGDKVKKVTAVSKTAAAALPASVEAVIVPNGLEVGQMASDRPRVANRVVFLGRDEPRKGLDVLLEAWPRIIEAWPGAELVVMGAIREVDGIEWMGVVDDETKADILGSAAVYVAPNTGGESFGIVLIEAMAAGAAVVASSLPAFVEVGGDAAIYFETGDSTDLAEQVVALLNDDDARESIAAEGAKRAGDYDWSKVAVSYRDLYEEAAS